MSNIVVNIPKAVSKWGKIMENLGVKETAKKEWIAEYAEYHSIRESLAYSAPGNGTGMGAVVSPQVSSIPGQTGYGTGVAGAGFGNGGSYGSGDYGQNLLPVSMKVAAHTIGLDLVAVKASPGPTIDLMYVDFRYDDGPTDSATYNPIVFKISGLDANGTTQIATLTTQLRTLMATIGVREVQSGLTQRMFFNLAANTSGITGVTVNGASTTRAQGSVGVNPIDVLVEPVNKEGVIEFLGFSRIDKSPMFSTYRTTNSVPQGRWVFDKTKNTFGEVETVKDAFELSNGSANPLASNILGFSDGTTVGGVKVELISALEDHIPGFTTNGTKHGMSREVVENKSAGIIAPNVTTQRVTVGNITISSAIQLTEMDDIKAQTGIDIIQKIESVLVNELSQTISKEIVDKVFEMGDLNRKSAPGYNPSLVNGGTTHFDFNVDDYLGSGSAFSTAPGGETSQSLQSKLVTKVKIASSYIATEGRVGPATYIVTNGTLAAVLTQGAVYSLSPQEGSSNAMGQLYPAGKVHGMTVYVDPNMLYNDNRILLGRKNNPDQPGVIFVPFLMAQSVSLTSESNFGHRMLLRSRYAVTTLGFFPQKQFITIYVTDTYNRLA